MGPLLPAAGHHTGNPDPLPGHQGFRDDLLVEWHVEDIVGGLQDAQATAQVVEVIQGLKVAWVRGWVEYRDIKSGGWYYNEKRGASVLRSGILVDLHNDIHIRWIRGGLGVVSRLHNPCVSLVQIQGEVYTCPRFHGDAVPKEWGALTKNQYWSFNKIYQDQE